MSLKDHLGRKTAAVSLRNYYPTNPLHKEGCGHSIGFGSYSDWLRRFSPDELVSGWRDVAEKQLSILVSASFHVATSYFSLACL